MVNRQCTKRELTDAHFQRAAYLLLRQGAMSQYACNNCDYRFHIEIMKLAFRRAVEAGGSDRAVDALMDLVMEAESKPIFDFNRKSFEPPQ